MKPKPRRSEVSVQLQRNWVTCKVMHLNDKWFACGCCLLHFFLVSKMVGGYDCSLVYSIACVGWLCEFEVAL